MVGAGDGVAALRTEEGPDIAQVEVTAVAVLQVLEDRVHLPTRPEEELRLYSTW